MTPAERLLARAERRVVRDLKAELAPLVSLAIDRLEDVLNSESVDATLLAGIRETLDRFAGKAVAKVEADVQSRDNTPVLLSSVRLDALLLQVAERRRSARDEAECLS